MDWYIIFEKGSAFHIDIVQAWDYEKDDYHLASRKTFGDEQEAIDYARELAKTHHMQYIGPIDKDCKHRYLD